uniref:LID domain-containing protein n=1 Tax=Strongyloides stercoralis TaxID=6248 RepID=A0A0K0EN82_STRER
MPRKRATENGANGNNTAPKQTRTRKKKDTSTTLPPTSNMMMTNVPNAYDHNGVAMQQMNGPSHMMMMNHDDGSLMQSSYGIRMPPNNVGHMQPQQPEYYYSQNNASVANGSHVPLHQQQGPPQHHGMYSNMPGQGTQQPQYLENDRSQNSFLPPPPPMHQSSINGGSNNPNQQHQMMMRMPQVQPQMIQQQQQQSHSGNMQQSQQTAQQQLGKQGKIMDMNNRMHTFVTTHIAECDKAQWWEAFSNEFFENDAKFTITFIEKGPLQYTIGRSNIPRFFKRLFECNIRESFYILQAQCKESPVNLSPHNQPIYMECDSVNYILKYSCTPAFEVHNNCRLMVEFGFDNMFGYRIRKWNLEMRRSKEITSNEYGGMQGYVPTYKPEHFMGIPMEALRLLEACVILEPMQALMHLTRSSNINPREALTHLSFQGYQKAHSHPGQIQQNSQMNMGMMNSMANQPNMMLPPGNVDDVQVKPKQTRKRQRKNASNSTAAGGRATPAKKKNTNQTASPMPPNPPPNYMPQNHGYHPQGVMVVSEPSMMGKGYGENDERAITRIENTYFDNQGYQQNYSNMHSVVNGLPPPNQQIQPTGSLIPQAVVSQSQQQQQMHQIPSSLAQHLAPNPSMNMGPNNNMLRT